MKKYQFSVVIAVFNRGEELTELLNSLSLQTKKDFETVIVDDGSTENLQPIVKGFIRKLNLKYIKKPNSGPAASRNLGMQKASGNYFIFFDSDTIIPENYIEIVQNKLSENYTDAYGGPDAADKNFSPLQKAISFSMTSPLTTGGIRGNSEKLGKFQPRSFNMGISKKAFEMTGGFGNLRIGEDPDLSMTLWENGFETQLIPEAKVYHKRRTSLKKFARQVYQFGVARPILNQRHPRYAKPAFWMPTLFLLGFIFSIIIFILFFLNSKNIDEKKLLPIAIYLIYAFLVFIFSIIENNFKTAFLSIITSFIQHFSYGFGFLKSWFYLNLLRKKPEKVFPHHFSK